MAAFFWGFNLLFCFVFCSRLGYIPFSTCDRNAMSSHEWKILCSTQPYVLYIKCDKKNCACFYVSTHRQTPTHAHTWTHILKLIKSDGTEMHTDQINIICIAFFKWLNLTGSSEKDKLYTSSSACAELHRTPHHLK